MEFIAQYVKDAKGKNETLQFVLTPQNATEKALLGAAYMIGCPRDVSHDHESGALEINFQNND